MALAKSSKIVRGLMNVTGKGTFLFNDKIQGGRSIKVWGWNPDLYQVAIDAMRRQGIAAKLVRTPPSGSPWRPGNSLRIHTQEA